MCTKIEWQKVLHVSQLGSCVEETDIQRILHQVKSQIPNIVSVLVTRMTTDDERAELKCALQTWISQKKKTQLGVHS